MTKATKAILLSGLVFPGAGHLYLKHKTTGYTLIAISLIVGYLLFQELNQLLSPIREQILTGQLAIDPLAIQQVHTLLDNSHSQMLTLSCYALIAIWLFSMIDCYRISRSANS